MPFLSPNQQCQSTEGISCSIPRSRQITMPAPHHSVFYRPDALSATQPTASRHWRQDNSNALKNCSQFIFFKSPHHHHHLTLWQLEVWIALAESFWELGDEVAENVVPDTQRRRLLEKLAQRIWQKLVFEMLQLHYCIEDIRSAVHKTYQITDTRS